MSSRFSPYTAEHRRRKSHLPPPQPVQVVPQPIPERIEYMDIDGLERPRTTTSSRARQPRAQPAHPHTTRQMRVVGSHRIDRKFPTRDGCGGTHMYRTRALSGGRAALGQFFGRGPRLEPMDIDDEDY
ncbi:hypothetical protein BGZ79_008652 [Entomortierella chlamydospora]|nr:hypothetical protein BGZ79_008652 [Entomortierella chlamydospora]